VEEKAGAGGRVAVKLVRDKIPDLINSHGEIACISIADHDEYQLLLYNKLQEEVGEYLESRSAEELADVLEVVYALAACAGLDESALERLRIIKANERGRFDRRIVWHGSRQLGTSLSAAGSQDRVGLPRPEPLWAVSLFDLTELVQPTYLGGQTSRSGRVTRARSIRRAKIGPTGQQLQLFLEQRSEIVLASV
jgi:predicted house-cleaning noncanonical NTP pyrophosphatase (MazG superfamily)